MYHLKLFAIIYLLRAVFATGKIDLSEFIVTVPSKEVGARVSQYDPANTTGSAWEMGECLSQPPKQGRNAINKESAKWPLIGDIREVPYTIIGTFSKRLLWLPNISLCT